MTVEEINDIIENDVYHQGAFLEEDGEFSLFNERWVLAEYDEDQDTYTAKSKESDKTLIGFIKDKETTVPYNYKRVNVPAFVAVDCE